MERPVVAPQLETERLVLRGFDIADLDALHAVWADPVVHRFITGKPVTRQDIWAKILRTIGHWHALGFGYWIVEDKETGRLIGEMGYGYFHRENMPLLEGRPEMGWVLAANYHRRGLAFEALPVLQAWGDKHLQSRESVCIISPGNSASLRIAEKLGFEFAGMADAASDPLKIYVRKR